MKKLTDYQGWAVVTGASSGIGRCFATDIAAAGVNCVLVARRGDRLAELARRLESEHGVKCRCIELDLTDADAVDMLVSEVRDIPVGILVNNAGFGYSGPFETRDPGRFENMIRLNCTVPVLLTRRFVPAMLERHSGAVIVVSSVLGYMPGPYDPVYAATKAFDLNFGQSLWAEMRGCGVDITTVCPSTTRTEFFGAGGMTQEQEKMALRIADPPEKISRIALKALGRKPVCAPFSGFYPGFLARFLSRRLVALIMRKAMRISLKSHQVR